MQREEVKPNGGGAVTKTLTLPADAGSVAEKLACFVWNGDLKPYFGVRQFN